MMGLGILQARERHQIPQFAALIVWPSKSGCRASIRYSGYIYRRRINLAKRNVGHTTIENLAAQVGMFFGTTEAHTRRWLGQREELIKALSAVQSRAGALIKELGGGSFRWTKS